MAKFGPLARRDNCAGVRVLDKLMTPLILMSAAVFAGRVVDVVAVAVGVAGAVVVVLALLASLMLCAFALLLECPPKRVCLPKVPRL